jgi:hypothetical protein|tara:strand:- start:42258 stop:42473 length:216 start_codon:yes stop_codon:yes gene_type:complete
MGRRITNLELDEKLADIKEDVRFIKTKLLDPDVGVTARVNKNTSFRKSTSKVLWSIWVALAGVLTKLIFWN